MNGSVFHIVVTILKRKWTFKNTKELYQPKKNCWKKIKYICFDVYKIYEGEDLHEISNVSSKLKNKKMSSKNELVQK